MEDNTKSVSDDQEKSNFDVSETYDQSNIV